MRIIKKVYKINISEYLNLNYLRLINDQRVLYYKSNEELYKYIVLPHTIILKKVRSELFLNSIYLTEKYVKSFFTYFLYWLRKSNKKRIKRLILKGLGFRFFSNEPTKITFKIGFSHLIELKVPNGLTFNIPEKNKLQLFGYNLSSLGNFYKKIRRLKLPNTYTGKGILSKNEKILLKPIKKT